MMNSPFDSFTALLDKNGKEETNPKIITRIKTGKEWRKEFCFHVSTIVKGFVDGVIDSQPMGEKGFRLPAKLDLVTNWIGFMLDRNFEQEPVISISVNNAVCLVRQWALDHPDFSKWQIDKEALFMNMAIRLMTDALTLENEKLQYKNKESHRAEVKQ